MTKDVDRGRTAAIELAARALIAHEDDQTGCDVCYADPCCEGGVLDALRIALESLPAGDDETDRG